MIYFANCIINYFMILFLLGCVAEGADLDIPESSIRGNKPRCNKPAGSIGDIFIQRCLKMTCTRKGRKGFWEESYASDKCCNYDQKWYEMGQNIKQTPSTNECYMLNIHCAKNKSSEPEIMIDTENQCANINDVEALLRMHANNSIENIQKLSDNMVGIENLLQIFLNKTDEPPLPAVTSKPNKTNPKPDTTTTIKARTTTTIPATSEAFDSEVLFIGPGYGTNGQSEVLNISSLTKANCTPPTFPFGIYAYVSTMTVDGPVLCGGDYSDCYLLTKSGVWLGTPPMKAMKTKRAYAAATKLGSGWWVTGGSMTATTELWINQSWHSYTSLPTAMQGHCLVKLNSTHVFLNGGWTGSASAASYIFSADKGFVKQEDMITARAYHACSLHSDSLIFVAGGYVTGDIKKTEYFSLLTKKWLPGPDLPIATRGGRMLSMNGKTVYIGGTGNKKIFQLEKLGGLSTVDWWKWIEVGEMKTIRHYFDVVKMKFEDCKYWNDLKIIQ